MKFVILKQVHLVEKKDMDTDTHTEAGRNIKSILQIATFVQNPNTIGGNAFFGRLCFLLLVIF